MNISEIFAYARKNNCSDIHISTGSAPTVRVDGDIVAIPNAPILTIENVFEILNAIMNKTQKKIYEEQLEFDFGVQIDEKLRYRANAFHTFKGPAIAFREIPSKIKTLEELGAPKIISEFVNFNKGLILVVGPTGSGKSSTLASLVNLINEKFSSHIITIEDPIEFVHTNKKSLINQREVAISTKSFSTALKNALREDPDVILVGEMRDIETIHLALTAAETGHLVLATLHTNSAAQAINRIIDVFPGDDKPVIRSMLSSSIKAVISQRLIKKKSGGRCGAFEVMIANPSIRNLIREDKIPQITSIMELGKKSGMQLMRDSLKDLLERDIISQKSVDEMLYGE